MPVETRMDLPMVAQTLDFTCGAACFESMYRYFHPSSPGEMHFAQELGALEYGYTPPSNIVKLARRYGLHCELKEQAEWADVLAALRASKVVFLTWWDEDAGHYSLLKSAGGETITLMDPWTAREGRDTVMPLSGFLPHWEARGRVMIASSPVTESL
jgi:predicted double-glycine peptidase